MKRKIITIDENKCNGCEECIPHCPEGAIQMIDGKARLISDRFCDGLGACLGKCPEDAITIEEREAEPYDELKVMERIVKQGPNVIKAHLEHLKDHKEKELLSQAVSFLRSRNIQVPDSEHNHAGHHQGCPSAMAKQFKVKEGDSSRSDGDVSPRLTHWPIQLHLLSPLSPAYQKADVLLAADCVPFAMGDFHSRFLEGKALAIACPKLDDGQEVYLEKLVAMIDEAEINTLSVIVMQVPCCSGLVRLASAAVGQARRKIPIKAIVVSLQGEVLREQWVEIPGMAEQDR